MRSIFVISSLAVFAAGCTCGHSSTVVSQGEVQWEWPGEDGGMQYGTSAYLTFPLTDMGTSRERTLTIRNMGVAALTLKELVHLDGTPTFLNAGDDEGSVFAVRWAPSTVVPPAET